MMNMNICRIEIEILNFHYGSRFVELDNITSATSFFETLLGYNVLVFYSSSKQLPYRNQLSLSRLPQKISKSRTTT